MNWDADAPTRMHGRVLICAGSDSGGGAGIQADIKAVTALCGFASTALTALTAQNTEGVHGIHEVPLAFVDQQIRVVLSDIGADCVKTGMLHSEGRDPHRGGGLGRCSAWGTLDRRPGDGGQGRAQAA